MTNNEIKVIENLKKKKYRDESGRFLIEGKHLLDECVKSDAYRESIELLIIRDDFEEVDFVNMIKNTVSNLPVEILEAKKFGRISDTVNSQGIAAVVKKYAGFVVTGEERIITALDNISDPGNFGTILRTCRWFGIKTVICGNNSVDVYNSKTIRSSQGAVFYVNVSESPDLNVTLKEMTYKGYNVILTTTGADTGLNDYKFESDKKYVIVFGNEASGISDEIVNEKSYDRISIEGYSDCESLNVATSVGIVMYKAASDMKKDT